MKVQKENQERKREENQLPSLKYSLLEPELSIHSESNPDLRFDVYGNLLIFVFFLCFCIAFEGTSRLNTSIKIENYFWVLDFTL